jgi:hypothetical protein
MGVGNAQQIVHIHPFEARHISYGLLK